MPIPEHGRRTSENPTLRSGATNLSDPRIADTCGVGVSNTSKRPVVDPSAWPPIKPARVQVSTRTFPYGPVRTTSPRERFAPTLPPLNDADSEVDTHTKVLTS